MYGGSCISENDFAGFQLTVEHVDAGHCLRRLHVLIHFSLPRQCGEGKQYGDESLFHFNALFTSFLNTSRPEKPMVLKV